MQHKYTPLTPVELANVEDGLTTDGRKIGEGSACTEYGHCSCGCGAHFGCFLDDWGLSK